MVETGSAKETHHFALLAGYGAEAVHPYLALETVSELAPKLSADLTPEKAQANFIKAINKGLMKIMSKMGIATYRSYCGAQIFEAVGLSGALVDKYFKGTVSSVEGIGVFEIAEESLRLHREAFGRHQQPVRFLDVGGEYAFRHQGEEHMFTPDAIAKLQHSARANNYATYKEYAQIINDQSRRQMTLRGLFDSKSIQVHAISIDEVDRRRKSSDGSRRVRCHWDRSVRKHTLRLPSR